MNKAIKEIKTGTALVGVKTHHRFLVAGAFAGIGSAAGDETVDIATFDGRIISMCRREKGSKTTCGDRAFQISDSTGTTKVFQLEKLKEIGFPYLSDVTNALEFYNKMADLGTSTIEELYRTLVELDVKKI